MKTIRVAFKPDCRVEYTHKFHVELPLDLFMAAIRGGYDFEANTLAIAEDYFTGEKILSDYIEKHFPKTCESIEESEASA